jgi:hypothetical protein
VCLGTVVGGCSGPLVHREGPPEAREVSATVSLALAALRGAVIAHMKARDTAPPVTGMWLVELNTWSPDWAVTYVDPGGYLAPYRDLPAADRARDLLLEDFTNPSWMSEYESDRGPVPFRCGFVVHFRATTPDSTRVSVYEVTPEVTVGKVWAWAHEGIGFARVDDIRLVEPTMTDRQKVLAWLETLAKR